MRNLLARVVGDKDYFPSQKRAEASVETITNDLRANGAPHYPKPKAFLDVPDWLEICQPVAQPDDLSACSNVRSSFMLPDFPKPFVYDIVRAFRLLRGAKTYVEVGTFDRGNLAYVASLLADDALIVGVDIQAEETQDAKLRSVLKPGQQYVSVVGNSQDPATVAKVRQTLGNRPLDAVFIDGDHTAYGAMSDYVNYGELVTAGGFVLFHDSLWEGDGKYKGVADALSEIDRLEPIYLVTGNGPIYRFMRPMFRDPLWGIVGVLRK